jgi:hypothetical protein
MRDFLEYLKNQADAGNIDKTARSILMWVIFFALVLVIYWNIISMIKTQIDIREHAQTVVKQYSLEATAPEVNTPLVENNSLSDREPNVVTVTIS